MQDIAILLPAFKRPEYTAKCIWSLEQAQAYERATFYLVDDGSDDETAQIFQQARIPKKLIVHPENIGLRNVILNFFEEVQGKYAYLIKLDNDVKVPANWLTDIMKVLETSDADILSPNVRPSHAAYKHGSEVSGKPYRPSTHVGGLWAMKAHLPENIYFDKPNVPGITAAFNVLLQIIREKEPVVGWLTSVTMEDMGHWSGSHDEHIASEEHREYSARVGRRVAW